MAEHPENEFAFLAEPDPERAWSGLLAQCLGTMERAAGRVALDAEEARDVLADVLERLRSDWPGLLERYRAGRSAYAASVAEPAGFRPWLAVVCRRLAIDALRSRHGRPTPPRAVQRMEPLGQRLFELLYRERKPLEVAYDTVIREGLFRGAYADFAASVGALEDALPAAARIAAAAPRRPERARGAGAGEQAGQDEPSAGAAERPAELAARRAAHGALGAVLAGLDVDERLLLRAYFLEGAAAVDVARLLGTSGPRAVYDRAQRLIPALREAFERRGLGPEDLGYLMDFDWNGALAEASGR